MVFDLSQRALKLIERFKASFSYRVTAFSEFLARFNAHPGIRLAVGKLRFAWFSRVNGIKTFVAKDARKNTVSHNLNAFKNLSTDFAMPRMEWLIKAVTSIEFVHRNSQFLVVGPRTEADILRLKGYGFYNVIGLDLISYSKLIVLGDMHNMPFAENSFDVVIMGWTLSYSNMPNQVANEIIRVSRPGALVAIGVEHITTLTKMTGGLLDPLEDLNRINTFDQVLGLFGSSVKNVFFRHDAPLSSVEPIDIVALNGLDSSQIMAVFQLI